jgi:hypothetical protein
MLAVELAVGGSLSGVAAASMTVNPSGFVNQASGNIAGSVIQSQKYASLEQRSFTPQLYSFGPSRPHLVLYPALRQYRKSKMNEPRQRFVRGLAVWLLKVSSSLPCFSKFIKTRLQEKIARIRTRKNIG